MSSAPQPGPLGVPSVWDAIAATYAKDVAPFFAKYATKALDLAGVGASARILDVATGPGTLALLAAPRVLSVSAVDFAPKMIEELRARADGEGIGNVKAEVMDAQSLGFEDASFDAAFCIFAFMFIPDRARAFRELVRVLRPKGKAVIATWAPIERRPFIRIGFEAMAETFPELPPMPKGDLQQAEACVSEMSAAGFEDVAVHPFTASIRIDSAEHYLQVMERSGAGFGAIRKRIGEEAWPRAFARLLDALRRRIPGGGAEFSAEALLSVGSR